MTYQSRSRFGMVWLLIGMCITPVRAESPKITVATTMPQARTLVTIHLKNAPAITAARELSKAAGITIADADGKTLDAAANVTLDADNKPFWPVMLDMARQAGLTVQAAPSTQDRTRLVFLPGKPNQTAPPSQMVGPFFIVAGSTVRTETMDYLHSDKAASTSQMRLAVYVDPQVTASAYFSSFPVSEAINDKGEPIQGISPMPARQAAATARGDQPAGMVIDLPVALSYTPVAGRMLKSLKGLARVQLLGKEDVWQIAELANAMGTERSFPGGRYTLVSLAPSPQNPAQYILKITIDYDMAIIGTGAPASPLIEYGTVRRAIRVTDALGHELSQATASIRNANPNQRELSITFALAGNPATPDFLPARLEWRIPLEILDVLIPIELHDLPLP